MRISIFLSVVMACAWLSSASPGQTVGRIGTGVPTQTPSSQSLISWSDFTYAGSYSVPTNTGSNNGGTVFTTGFTGRYVGSTLQFIGLTNSGLYEFDLDGQAPVISSNIADLNSVRMLQDYGNIFTHTEGQGTGSGCTESFGPGNIYSLRTIGTRLYYGYGNIYPTPGCDYDGGLGYFDLGTYPAAPTNVQAYILDGIGYKTGERGFVEVPNAWSGGTYSNLSGKTISQAGGSYESIITTGGTSMGPSLIPFTPPTGLEANRTALANYPLSQFGSACSPRGRKPVVSPVYINYNDFCDSTVFGWQDWIRGVEWISTAHKKGILHFTSFSTGIAAYIGAIVVTEGVDTQVLITDPSSLATIANGGAAASTADWIVNTSIQWPLWDYATPCAQLAPCAHTAATIATSGPTATATVADTSLTSGGRRIVISGANESEFNTGYVVVEILDATHFTFCSGVNGGSFSGTTCNGSNWANAVGTGTITYQNMQGLATGPLGIIWTWFDTTTNTLWAAAAANLAKMVIHKYTCVSC